MRFSASVLLIAVSSLLLVAVSVFAGGNRAWAQGEAECVDAVDAVDSCAPSETYPGPFVNMPDEPSVPGDVTLTPPSPVVSPVEISTVIDPIAQPSPATDTDGLDLAHSGTESYVLAYLGTGMLAFGLVSLGLRRSSRVFAD